MRTHEHELDEAALRAACGNGRMSPQRVTIARTASSMHGAFTIDELHRSALSTLPGLGVATTYRAVAAMTSCGTLANVGDREGHALYIWCGRGEHHHHLICTSCGAAAGIDCPLPEEQTRKITSATGITITRHELTMYGLCDECRKKGER